MISPIDLVVVGGSAGSLDPLIRLLSALDPLRAPAIVVVIHRKAGDDSTLTDLLSIKSTIPVKEAEEKDLLRSAQVYLAPGDYHLLVETDGTLSLDYSEKLNFSRPSIDITFQTASEAYGKRSLCLLLSGANSDGTEGMRVAELNGSLLAVQEPDTADVPYMPRHAMNALSIERIIPANQLANFINGLNPSRPGDSSLSKEK